MGKVVRGVVEVSRYKNGKLVKKEQRKDSILNEDHWKGWSKFDKDLGAKSYTRSNFDYVEGTRLITSHSTSLGNEKVVYKRVFDRDKRRRK